MTTDLATAIPAAAIMELEKLADEQEATAAEARYKAAGLMAQAAAVGHSLRDIGKAIDKSHTHVRKCITAYAAMGGSVAPEHFPEFYRRARGSEKSAKPRPAASKSAGNLGFQSGEPDDATAAEAFADPDVWLDCLADLARFAPESGEQMTPEQRGQLDEILFGLIDLTI